MPRVIVTRPQPEAGRWTNELAERGFDAVALPLIEIAPVDDPRALQAARNEIDRFAALFFVSGNAARHFFEPNAPVALVGPSFVATNCRAWAPGPGTAAALRAAGVPQARIDAPADDAAQFDSEALWQVVRPQAGPGKSVLIVRGADAGGEPAGRDWLARQLRARGVEVQEVAAYQRRVPAWTDAQAAFARSALAGGSVWLLSSSQALAHLQQLLPDASLGPATAIATHPRIAHAARSAGFGVVYESRPDLDSTARYLKSMG